MPDGVSLAAYAAASLVTAESLRKLIVSRLLGHEIGRDYVTIGLLLIGVSLAAGAPVSLRASDEYLGVLNVAFVLSCLAAMTAMVCAAGFLRTATVVCVRVRVALGVCAACATVMGALYLVAGVDEAEFGAPSHHDPASIAFTIIYLSYMSVALGWLAWGMRQIGREVPPSVRRGLSLGGAGLLIGLLGVLWQLIVVVESWWNPPGGLRDTHVSFLAEAAGAVTFAAGTVYAAAAQRLYRRRDQRRAAAVEQLWHALEPARIVNPLGAEDDDIDIHRQRVEILDAFLILRNYVHPEVTTIIHDVLRRRRLRGRCAQRIHAAAERRTALRAHQTQLKAPAPTPHIEPRPEADPINTDDDAELTWLAHIGRTWHHPAVDEILDLAETRLLRTKTS